MPENTSINQSLPDETLFVVLANRSYDENPLIGDETVYPQDSLEDDEIRGPWSFDDSVEFLWRMGKVPEWIDVAVISKTRSDSIVELRCCGRFTATEELLYHRSGDIPPFSVKSPALPPGWKGVETSGRFDLDWLTRLRSPDS